MENKAELPVISFRSAKEWHSWLSKNAGVSAGIWLKIFKKDSNEKTVTYAEALDEALCYGWIDGQKKSLDEQAWLQKFCPRRPKSIWSKVNITHVERLSQEGRMKPGGLAAVAAAKADGRWEAAYDAPSKMAVPDDFLKVLAKNKKALAFYHTLNKANLFAIAFRLQTTKKPETRQKRMEAILAMLSKGEKFH
ncbi:MAG: bacteriocin-protection protein, YdeI/OmpD-associated family [Bacteroidetes bacterium 46-16]|nr:MAG: bacteriocin-protection protein, YdeI/OmpD-associated family [Bacteroidetes bacterium 46-16]